MDSYGTLTDGIVLETGAVTTAESTEINRIFLQTGGEGYTKLPTITVTSLSGKGGEVIANTTTIGKVEEGEISDGGFK